MIITRLCINNTSMIPVFLLICMTGIVNFSIAGTHVQPTVILYDESAPDSAGYHYRDVLFSQDANSLIAASAKSIDFWDIESKKIIRSIKPEDFNTNNFSMLSFSEDLSKFTITNSSSQMQDGILYARLIDTQTAKVIWEIESQPDEVFTNPNSYPGQIVVRSGYAYLSPSGKRAVMNFRWDHDERGIFLTNALTGEFIRTFDFSKTDTWKFLPDDKLLVYKTLELGNNRVRIYDLLSGDLIRESVEPEFANVVSTEYQCYAWFPQDNAIRAYDIENGPKSQRYSMNDQTFVQNYAISSDGRKILYDDNTASLYIAELIQNQDKDSGEIAKRLTLVDIDPGIIGSTFLFYDNSSSKYVGIITFEEREIWLWDLEELGLSGVKQGEEYR